MRITFDHQAFCRQTAGGISRYFCRLAQELALEQQEVGVFAPFYRNVYLKDLPPRIVHGYSVKNYPPKTAGFCVEVNAWLAKSMMHRWQPDIVHETYFSSRAMSPAGCPSVITVFDMISELDALQTSSTPIDFKKTDKYKAVERAEHVICISEHTRQDLVRLFNIPESKLSVIHLGCDQPAAAQRPTPITKSSKPYLLFVGLRGGYKNFDGMLRGIAASRRLINEYDVIAFGGEAFTTPELSLIHSLGFKENQVTQVAGHDQKLNSLYQQAAALIYPSKYEWFVLPPLEAMAMQCPVISSDASCMPEIIGEAAQYFDPNQTGSIQLAIESVVFDQGTIQNLISKGNQRVGQFTWANCAEKTLNVYQSINR
jgi:glycosyltransferase involved in cell wall biosynthesis